MALIEIIKSSLSIFSTTAFIFIAVSYTIYKIKDRSRMKPYSKVNRQNPFSGIINDEKGDENNINMKENLTEENRFDRIGLVKLPIQNRFKIINGEVTVEKLFKPGYKKEYPIHKLNTNDGKKNIYGFYEWPNEEINKLKLVTR